MDPDELLASLGGVRADDPDAVLRGLGGTPVEKPEAEPVEGGSKLDIPAQVQGVRHDVTVPTTDIVAGQAGPGATHGDVVYNVDPQAAALHQVAAQVPEAGRAAFAGLGSAFRALGGGRGGMGQDESTPEHTWADLPPQAASYVDQLRAAGHELDTASQEHPIAAGAGQVLGGVPEAMAIPLPGGAGGGVGAAAQRVLAAGALGGASNLQRPTGDLSSGAREQGAEQLATGAAYGAGSGVLGEAGSAGLGLAGRGLRRAGVGLLGGPEAVARDAALARIRAQGGTIRDERLIEQNFPGGVQEFARHLRESGVQGMGRGFEEMATGAGAERDKAGRAISDILTQAGQAGAAPTRESILSAARSDGDVAELLGSAVVRERRAGERMLEELDNAILSRMDPDTQTVPLQALEGIKQDFARSAGYGVVGEVNPSQLAYQGGRRGILGSQEAEIARAAPAGSGEAYLAARRRYGAMAQAQQMASDRAMREASNRLVSPSDYAATLATLASTGNPLRAGAAFAANRALRRGEHLGAATALEGLLGRGGQPSDRRNPALVRAAMLMLQQGHSGDLAAAAAHFTKSETDNDYRAASQPAEDQ